MAITTYVPDSSLILHETKVDFIKRDIVEYVHVVQYDKNLSLLAIELYMDGEVYTLPPDSFVKIRWGKEDHTFVYKDALGCNEERNIVYFEVDQQMSYFYGAHYPILELAIDGNFAGSSPVPVFVDRNPIQEGDIESQVIYPDIDEAVRICSEAAEVVASLSSRVGALETGKQNTLVSGTNIKTINSQSLLGSGNINITPGGGSDLPDFPLNDGSYLLELTMNNGSGVLSWNDDVATFSQSEGGVTLA